MRITLATSVGGLLVASVVPHLPVQPVLVTTASVPRGLYLVDTRAEPRLGDMVAFRHYAPAWAVSRRYQPDGGTVVKILAGMPGHVIDATGDRLAACHTPAVCRDLGAVLARDTAGRSLQSPWRGRTTLAANQYYVSATYKPTSYDSRYIGAISRHQILGVAKPVWLLD